MLPVRNGLAPSLADVMPSCLSSIRAESNSLALAPVDKSVVLLVDGLGAFPLAARAGHARTLAPRLSKATKMAVGFPTTTAASLASLTTGRTPGIHGLVGYTALDTGNDRVVNQLSGWDDRMDSSWQRSRTVFEQATDLGVPSYIVGEERFRHSGFTAAVLRGATYRSGASIGERFAETRRILDGEDSAIVYLYVAELDQAGHAFGWESMEWTRQLETIDEAVHAFAATLGRREGLLVTADHGMIDVPHRAQVLFDENAGLVDGIRFVAGEPRCLQLHFEPDAGEGVRSKLLENWRSVEGDRAWVLTRDEAIVAGWFGPVVDAEVAPRIGDLIVAARKRIAYYDSRAASQKGRSMIGQHGSWSPEETTVPLLRFGAYDG
jgi:hypothetical protein